MTVMRAKYLLLRSNLRAPVRTEKPLASISRGKKIVSHCLMIWDSAELRWSEQPTFDHDGEPV